MLPFVDAAICLSTCVPIKKRHKQLYQPRNKAKICAIFLFYFISIFILLTRRKATEALIHRVGNYPDLLPEMLRYCCPLVI